MTSRVEQLIQLKYVTWDGDLIDKVDRDRLVNCGYVEKYNGWNFLTFDGIDVLVNLGLLKLRRLKNDGTTGKAD